MNRGMISGTSDKRISMHVLFLTDDLMFASRVVGAANGLKLEVQLVAPAKVAELAADPNCRLVLADLQVLGPSATEILPRVKQMFPQARLIGFGPHVATEMLSNAQAAGCDQVLTKGEFQRQHGDLLLAVAKEIAPQ